MYFISIFTRAATQDAGRSPMKQYKCLFNISLKGLARWLILRYKSAESRFQACLTIVYRETDLSGKC